MVAPFADASHLEREYLPIRAKVLEIAAALDRIERQNESETADPRWQQLRCGIEILLESRSNRTERVQLLFSRDYDAQWRSEFGI